MSGGYLLDTSAAILIRDSPGFRDARLFDLDIPPVLSVVTRIELEGGLGSDPATLERRLELLTFMLTLLQTVPFDDSCAEAYRTIIAACGYSRRKVVDRMIAATALAHDLTLITANPADFRDVPGLALIAW